MVKFGTIDDIKEIKAKIDKDTHFNLKKQIKDESDYAADLENSANDTLNKLLEGASFEITAQNAVLNDNARIIFSTSNWMYRDEIKEVFAEVLFEMEPGEIHSELLKYDEQAFALAPPIKIASIIKLFDKEEVDRVTQYNKEVKVSHILIVYEGAMRADETITRTKEEAKSLADELKVKLDNGDNFATLARQNSDDSSNSEGGGVLLTPAGVGTYVEEFENAALALENEGKITDVIETPFGYHIIKADEVTPASEESIKEERVKFGVLFYALIPAEWENVDFSSDNMKNVKIMYAEDYDPYLIVSFNEEGTQALKELTEQNQEEILGIFIGSELITSFTVKEVNVSGTIKILRPKDTKEADNLKELFETKPHPAHLIFIEEVAQEPETETDEE
jgi:parvulin-like peptidyl-prolyl isomerase